MNSIKTHLNIDLASRLILSMYVWNSLTKYWVHVKLKMSLFSIVADE